MSDVTGTSSSAGAAIISSLGVGSGLNVSSIISQLMAVQNQPVTLLQNQEAADQTTVSDFGQLQSALSTFQTAMQGLNSASNYQSVTAKVGNTAIATATATSAASAGSYSLLVNNLAQSQTLVTAGQADSTSSIGAGTISFSFGSITGGTDTSGKYSGATFTNGGAAPQTVTIDPSNDSLTGIAAAINAANIGVTASILNDGSSNPARLSLTVTNPGAANSLQISVTGNPATDTTLSNLLSNDPGGTQNLTETSTAQNAQFTLNGIAITSPTNTVSNAISGVTLNLLSTNTSSTMLTVSKSTSGTTNAINSFVSAYNTIQSVISTATAYNSTTKTAGPLQGQNSVNSIMNQIQAILNAPVPGAPNAISMLAQVGVGFNSDGTMSVDSTKLNAALASNPSAVAGLFSSTGTSSDSLINYTSSSSATQPGAYAVNITQLATQGNTTGSTAANLTVAPGLNDLQVTLDGVSATVNVAAGTYTSYASLASALQTAINSTSAFSSAGLSASVSQNGGILSVSSNSYGSSSAAAITGGNALSGLFGTQTTTGGLDVAGSINGALATGTGQTLTANANDASAGLAIQVLGGALGARGTINYTQGYANALNNLLTTVLSKTGQITAATDSLNATILNIQNSITSDTNINSQVQTALQAEYSALDVTMSKFNSTSTYLTQQLAQIAANSSS